MHPFIDSHVAVDPITVISLAPAIQAIQAQPPLCQTDDYYKKINFCLKLHSLIIPHLSCTFTVFQDKHGTSFAILFLNKDHIKITNFKNPVKLQYQVLTQENIEDAKLKFLKGGSFLIFNLIYPKFEPLIVGRQPTDLFLQSHVEVQDSKVQSLL